MLRIGSESSTLRGMSPRAFFNLEDEQWFRPTDWARGPWDPEACHAGPPSGLLARGLERAVPDRQLVRLTVELMRPVPMSGVRVEVEVERIGRASARATAELRDAQGKCSARALGLFVTPRRLSDVPTRRVAVPDLDEAEPGAFPFRSAAHELPSFLDAVEVRYPPGEDTGPGPTTVWMKTPPLLSGEAPSPFQSLCPLADCVNGFGRNGDVGDWRFLNLDLTIHVHRPPAGAWRGLRAWSQWEPSGTGVAGGELFDAEGLVGFATQTLMVERGL